MEENTEPLEEESREESTIPQLDYLAKVYLGVVLVGNFLILLRYAFSINFNFFSHKLYSSYGGFLYRLSALLFHGVMIFVALIAILFYYEKNKLLKIVYVTLVSLISLYFIFVFTSFG